MRRKLCDGIASGLLRQIKILLDEVDDFLRIRRSLEHDVRSVLIQIDGQHIAERLQSVGGISAALMTTAFKLSL